VDVVIVLTIENAIVGAVGGIIIGGRLADSSFGEAVNAFIGLVGRLTVCYLLAITLPDLASSVSKGSLGAILASIGPIVDEGDLIVIFALVNDIFGASRGRAEALNPWCCSYLCADSLRQNSCVLNLPIASARWSV
jgi:hypothetical protein